MAVLMNIAICDDEEIMTRIAKEKLEQVLDSMGINDYSLDCYHNGKDLLNSEKNYHLLLLDIEMPEIDGFSLAKELNQLAKKKPFIIFLTSHKGLSLKGYHVNAFRFLVKPIKDKELQEAISSAVKELMMFCNIVVKVGKEKELISIRELIYIEALGDSCNIYTQESSFVVTEPLKYWKKVLPEALFIQTHKSYLINLQYLKRIKESNVYLKNGEEIPLAFRRRKEVTDTAHEFVRMKGRG